MIPPRRILASVAAAVLLGAAGYALLAHRVPDGQAPLASMNLAAFQDSFNRASASTRVIVLLSPT